MTRPARIPADVDRPDKVVGPFTARQVAIIAITAGGLYLLWTALRTLVPMPVFLIAALPVGALAFLLAVGQRDGLPLDRLLLAALRHRITLVQHRLRRATELESTDLPDDGLPVPSWLATDDPVQAPRSSGSGVGSGRASRSLAGFPARAVDTATGAEPGADGVGVLDLGPDGLVAIAAVSTVNLTLRTPTEQDALIDTFARYLHTLNASVQILVRAVPLDLTAQLRALHTQARALPHPALAAAASAHRDHLAHLAGRRGDHELLSRQVLLILRGSTAPANSGTRDRAGAEHRLLRRLDDAATLLAPLDVTVIPLTAAQITALLTTMTNPDQTTPRPDAARNARSAAGPTRRRHLPHSARNDSPYRDAPVTPHASRGVDEARASSTANHYLDDHPSDDGDQSSDVRSHTRPGIATSVAALLTRLDDTAAHNSDDPFDGAARGDGYEPDRYDPDLDDLDLDDDDRWEPDPWRTYRGDRTPTKRRP